MPGLRSYTHEGVEIWCMTLDYVVWCVETDADVNACCQKPALCPKPRAQNAMSRRWWFRISFGSELMGVWSMKWLIILWTFRTDFFKNIYSNYISLKKQKKNKCYICIILKIQINCLILQPFPVLTSFKSRIVETLWPYRATIITKWKASPILNKKKSA